VTATATATRPWLDDWRGWRDRLVADPRFRRWAAAFPFTRPIARRRTRALFDLCAGFVYSQVLQACVQLRLFDILADGPQTPDTLAARLSLPVERTQRLLLAATSLKLLTRRRGERFGLGPLGAAMVGNAAVSAMVLHHRELYADLNDPVALLRGQAGETALSRYWAYSGHTDAAGLPEGQVAEYTALMAASQPLVADEVLAAYRIGRHRRLLDVGGGDGSFLCAVAAAAPNLQLMLFDLPPVAEQARARLEAAGLADRFMVQGGDFLADPLPQGADIVSLVRVIHDHDNPAALAILRAARRALPPGGTLLLAEPMAGTPGAEPIGDAYFGFYLMAMGRGRARTQAELSTLLDAAGFTGIRLVPTHTPLLVSVIVAKAAQDPAQM
jgi:demethylspheroidene O-methyltransferase